MNDTDGLQVYKRLVSLALPHWRIFLLGIIGMVANGLADVAFAYLMKPLMDQGFLKPDPELALFFALTIVGIFFLRVRWHRRATGNPGRQTKCSA